MNLYTLQKRFDARTGKEIKSSFEIDINRAICDYTGEEINLENQEECSGYNFSIEYNHDSEPAWYGDYHEFDEKYSIDYGSFSNFLDSPYHFQNLQSYGGFDVSMKLANDWIKAIKSKKESDLKRFGTLEQVFIYFRLKTLKEILKSKKYTLPELGLEIDTWDTGASS